MKELGLLYRAGSQSGNGITRVAYGLPRDNPKQAVRTPQHTGRCPWVFPCRMSNLSSSTKPFARSSGGSSLSSVVVRRWRCLRVESREKPLEYRVRRATPCDFDARRATWFRVMDSHRSSKVVTACIPVARDDPARSSWADSSPRAEMWASVTNGRALRAYDRRLSCRKSIVASILSRGSESVDEKNPWVT